MPSDWLYPIVVSQDVNWWQELVKGLAFVLLGAVLTAGTNHLLHRRQSRESKARFIVEKLLEFHRQTGNLADSAHRLSLTFSNLILSIEQGWVFDSLVAQVGEAIRAADFSTYNAIAAAILPLTEDEQLCATADSLAIAFNEMTKLMDETAGQLTLLRSDDDPSSAVNRIRSRGVETKVGEIWKQIQSLQSELHEHTQRSIRELVE